MADEQLAHLKDHVRFFDGLLSLIPANMYNEQDRSDQWQKQKRKQSKEEARAAKRAKLDPNNSRSVKDLMDANDPSRVLNGEGAQTGMEGLVFERESAETMKDFDYNKNKQGNNSYEGYRPSDAAEKGEPSTAQKLKAERKQAKKDRKIVAQAAKREEKRKRLAEKTKRRTNAAEARTKVDATTSAEQNRNDTTVESSEFGGLSEGNAEGSEAIDNTSQSSRDHSPVFDAAAIQSGTSSISSLPDLAASNVEKPKEPAPKPSQEELKLRLQKRLTELRAARKADKEDGTPKITRQQLLEQRREKEAQRKAQKKAVRKEAKEAERLKHEEEISNGSPLMSPSIGSPASRPGQSPLNANNFAFGRIAFDNGQSMTPKLDTVVDADKKKASHNPKLALQAAERRNEKLAQLDPEKRAEAAAKDMWATANKHAHGERVRDNISLLKKTLKRKENKKKKSESQWNARLQGVAASQEARQRKREENIQKRKDSKGVKGKGKKKGIKTKARPGFEGSFRAEVKRK